MNRFRWLSRSIFASGLLIVALGTLSPARALDKTQTEQQIGSDVEFLASDQLEGRGINTEGIRKAADFIREQFKESGLKSAVPDGSYFQPFQVRTDAAVDEKSTHLVFERSGGDKITLEMGKDYRPLSYGGTGSFNAPIVFAGYGITAEKEKYDDFSGIDVAGKVVIIVRREPQQDNPNSVFAGKELSEHAGLIPKIQNAWTNKAAAVLLVSDPFSTPTAEDDQLVSANYLGFANPVGIPVAQITQAAVNKLLGDTPLESLAAVEKKIDADLKPASMEIPGWKVEGEFKFDRVMTDLVNVVGMIEGEGPHADETIIIGAHYDHLGRGGSGSLAPGSQEIHNGADDNASGTAALLEMARRFGTGPKPSRRLVFMAFSAEEAGLLGSRHYVKKGALFPLDKTIAMLNFDMVGRLDKEELTLFGTGTAKEFEPMLEEINSRHKLQLKKVALGSGASDHASFYNVDIPVIHFFTGTHKDYHKPSDDFDKINVPGILRVVNYSDDLLRSILSLDARPAFVKVQEEDPHAGMSLPGGKMAYLGTIPDYGDEVEGVMLNGVREGSPADKGGLKQGDIIVAIAGTPIPNARALTFALYKHKPGETVEITVLRDHQKVNLSVTLGSRSRGS